MKRTCRTQRTVLSIHRRKIKIYWGQNSDIHRGISAIWQCCWGELHYVIYIRNLESQISFHWRVILQTITSAGNSLMWI